VNNILRSKGGKMSLFKPIPENEAKEKVKEIYDEIKNTRQITEVPNFWKMLANDPNELDRTWSSLKEIMKKGALDPVTKELIYVAVSITNGCEYCIKSHSSAAKKKGATDEMLKEMFAVVGLANKNNKLVDSYQVEVDKIYK
jgi:AhpD family alkylhydroperoxidase